MKANKEQNGPRVTAKKSSQSPEVPIEKVKLTKRMSGYEKGPHLGEEFDLSKLSLTDLAAQLRQTQKSFQQKQRELFSADKECRIETFRNQYLKSEYLKQDQIFTDLKMQVSLKLLDKYRGKTESPLFYNEHGLSPFDLMFLGAVRNIEVGNICLICYADIELGAPIIVLPCHHFLHRECGMQNLLYSKYCPSCGEIIDMDEVKQAYRKKLNDK